MSQDDKLSSDDILAIDTLLAAVASLPKVPHIRIIVGMPGFADDGCFKRQSESETMMLIGRVAYEHLLRIATQRTVAEPWSIAAARVFGVLVEFFGDHPDHFAMLREMADEAIKARFLRVALDEEFGNTDPRLP